MKLAIYCFARGNSGNEERDLHFQEEGGRRHASLTKRADDDCEIYHDTSSEVMWEKRPNYEPMKHDIIDGKVDEVWARDITRLHPFKGGENESFEALCKSKGVKVSFGVVNE